MKKILSLCVIIILLCSLITACGNNIPEITSTETADTETVIDTQKTAADTPTAENSNNSKASDNPETDKQDVNTELISYVGKPFSYFVEKYGWTFEDMEILNEGPPVGHYTYDGVKFTFNNLLGYDDLTEETPCTELSIRYTDLLPGIGADKLTEEMILKIFGEYSDEYKASGFLDVFYQEDTVIRFHISETGQFEEYVDIVLWLY